MGNREHRYVDRRLSAYVDGELGNRERARVESHLARCHACRASIRSLRWTKQLLRQAPAVKVPRAFVVREADLAQTRRAVALRRPLAATQWATAVVALLFILVLGGDLLLGARLPGVLDGRSLRSESDVAAPMALESEQVAAVEQVVVTVPAEAEVAEKVVQQAAPVEEGTAPPAEEALPKVAPEAETVRDLPDQPPGVRGEFAAPVTTTVPGEPMMALVAPDQTYTETQDAEPPVPEGAAPEAVAREAETPPAPGTPMPAPERRSEGGEPEMPTGGGGETGERASENAVSSGEGEGTWAGRATRGILGPLFWIGLEALLGVALVGLVVAVVWMRLRR